MELFVNLFEYEENFFLLAFTIRIALLCGV